MVIGITLNTGAYLTEILRGGFISVRRGRARGGRDARLVALRRRVRYVILPHIAKTIYAPLCNFFIWLVLGSSMAAIFGVEELTGRAINIAPAICATSRPSRVVAVIYIVLTFVAIAVAGAGRPLGVPRQGEDLLMLDRLIEEVPRFFNLLQHRSSCCRRWARRWR